LSTLSTYVIKKVFIILSTLSTYVIEKVFRILSTFEIHSGYPDFPIIEARRYTVLMPIQG